MEVDVKYVGDDFHLQIFDEDMTDSDLVCESTQKLSALCVGDGLDDWFVLTSNDLSFGLEPRDIKRFSADLFLDFTSKPETPMLFLLLNSSARMRIGNRNEWNEKYLDFMIQL